MYEVLEHLKQYKKEKERKESLKQMDKFLNELITKNGTTKI